MQVVLPGVLTVGTDPTFPPFESMNGAAVQGFDVDLAKAIGRELRLAVSFSNQSSSTLIPQLNAGAFDIIMSGMTITPALSSEIAFSQPYIDANLAIVAERGMMSTLDGNDPFAADSVLSGKTVGVVSGSMGELWVRENLRRVKQVLVFDSTKAAFSALDAGKFDALVDNLPISSFLVTTSYPGVEVIAEIPTSVRYGIGIATNKPDLKRVVDEALQRVIDSGEYNAIFTKWFVPKARSK